MMKLLLFILWIGLARADTGTLVTAGLQTNPAANTVEANTSSLVCGGSVGCDYAVTLILHSSNAMTFTLQALDAGSVVVFSMIFSIPGGNTQIFSIPTSFLIPNGYSLRVLNNTAQILGATSQATIVYEPTELR